MAEGDEHVVAFGDVQQRPVTGSGYNSVALPTAAGFLEPAFGLVLRSEIAVLSMSGSSFLSP